MAGVAAGVGMATAGAAIAPEVNVFASSQPALSS